MTALASHALRRWARETRGAAALEFALWLGVLLVPTLSALDLGFYAFQALQVKEAAQVAVQSAWTVCGSSTDYPATQNCGLDGASLNQAIATGEHSTSLKTGVTMSSGSEQYKCVTSGGALSVVDTTDGVIATSSGDVSSSGNSTFPSGEPATCSGTIKGSTAAPGDYITVTVTYTFKPLFGGVSVASLLGSTITQTATTRLQ